jgi:hypothetical protein
MIPLQRRPAPVDWHQLLIDLAKVGINNMSAATAINVPYSTLKRWKKGSVPNHTDGEALRALHREYCTHVCAIE